MGEEQPAESGTAAATAAVATAVAVVVKESMQPVGGAVVGSLAGRPQETLPARGGLVERPRCNRNPDPDMELAAAAAAAAADVGAAGARLIFLSFFLITAPPDSQSAMWQNPESEVRRPVFFLISQPSGIGLPRLAASARFL